MPRVIPDLLTEEDFPIQFGRYTLQGVVGEGGMARVYAAELRGPSGFTKPVAIKIIRAGIASRGERLRRSLINEARVGGLLNHPNVVEVNDFGEVDGLPFIAMPLVRGVGLDQLLRVVKPLPPGIALKIGLHMCAGLDHAHNIQAGDEELVHRDLKPSNVIISRHGVGRILDFGIAKATALSTDATDTGQTKGTPAYMSPEQVAGEHLDRRSDIFALGALLYEMLAGETMFGAASMVATLQQIVGVETHVLTSGKLETLEDCLEGASAVVHRCLRLDPDLRYSDATELEADLSTLLDCTEAVPPLRVWVRDIMATHDLHRGSFDGSESVPSDSRIPAVGQVQWKQAASSGVGPTRAQVAVVPSSSLLPPEPAVLPVDLASTAPAAAPVSGPAIGEDSVNTDPRGRAVDGPVPAVDPTSPSSFDPPVASGMALPPAAPPAPAAPRAGAPPRLPSADSLPARPSSRRGAEHTSESVQPRSEGELQDSFFGTKAVSAEAVVEAAEPAAAGAEVARTRVLPARTPPTMGHPPADGVGPTNRHPRVEPWRRTMMPVVVFALGLTVAVAGVAFVASTWLSDRPAPSELALADISARQSEDQARERAEAEERSQEFAARRAEEAAAEAGAATPEPRVTPKRRSTRRRSTRKPKPSPTPTPTPAPAATPTGSAVPLRASATILDRSGPDAKVLFTVRAEGKLEGVPTLNTLKPGSKWKPRPMKRGRGGRYTATIRFTRVVGEEVSWYVTANRGAATVGSAASPRVLKVR